MIQLTEGMRQKNLPPIHLIFATILLQGRGFRLIHFMYSPFRAVKKTCLEHMDRRGRWQGPPFTLFSGCSEQVHTGWSVHSLWILSHLCSVLHYWNGSHVVVIYIPLLKAIVGLRLFAHVCFTSASWSSVSPVVHWVSRFAADICFAGISSRNDVNFLHTFEESSDDR